jgi:hypothetical protein
MLGEMLSAPRVLAIATVMVGCVAVAGCGSGSGPSAGAVDTAPTPSPSITKTSPPTPTPTRTHTVTASPEPTTTVTVTAPAVTASPSSTATVASATNLPIDSVIRRQLVAAGAASHNLPATDFIGLVPGETYYSSVGTPSTYWAGAGLVPRSSSMDAGIAVQDDGSYLAFRRTSTGSWRAYNVGLAGIAGSTCPVKIPNAVLAVWRWKPNTCRPPS